MIQVLEYIAQNYTSFLSVLILILLAIIGYYADKSNFGQGKNEEKKIKDKNDEPKKMKDLIDSNNSFEENSVTEIVEQSESKEKNIQQPKTEEKLDIAEQPVVENNLRDDNIVYPVNNLQSEQQIKKEVETKEYEEIEFLLPEKELINSDLLNEIEGMEFNSIKERTSFDVPDLDDISLPKIKKLVEKEQDIWKF